jgi:hypothetical protein
VNGHFSEQREISVFYHSYLLNTHFYRKNSKEIAERAFLRYGLKESSVEVYSSALTSFCEFAGVTNPCGLNELGIDSIEILMQQWINQNRNRLSPKFLNVTYCSVKRWCQIHGLIKSTKMFREIKFDKSSRKTDALTETMLETKHIKAGFKIANLEDQIDWGLYALCGLRPRIIPQLKVKNLYQTNYEIIKDEFRFTVKPPLMIIPRTYAGNKANITFMIFIPTKLADLMQMQLNTDGNVTAETKISGCGNAHAVYYKIKCLFGHPSINFTGRPYLLRKYADRILDRITRIYNDEDLKEFLMGHKGKISGIYQTTGLTEERENELREMYVNACGRWISRNIFETASQEEIERAEMLIAYSEQIAELDKDKTEALKNAIRNGTLTVEALQAELGKLTREALDRTMEAKFEQLFLRMNAKYNNQ